MTLIEKDFREIVSYALCLSEPYLDRAHSFDFCYQYFTQSPDIVLTDIEKSCYVLWAFLSSWGMVRGSTELLHKNQASLKGVINYIAENDDLRSIDLRDYSKAETREKIIKSYGDIRRILTETAGIEKPSMTLVTKIMLGVFSCIPAFDANFCEYYNAEFLRRCSNITDDVLINLSKLREHVRFEPYYLINFDGTKSKMAYNQVKLLDIYGFNKGMGLNAEEKINIKKGNLFDKINEFGIDGIFAPVYAGRHMLIDEYKQRGVYVPHLIEYSYTSDLDKKECRKLYFAQLDALSSLGARRLATYPLYVKSGLEVITGKEKVKFIHSVIRDWCIKNDKKFDSMYYFDLE